jgi:hypothetical protein
MAHNPAGSYCARTILTANGLRSKMTPVPRRSDKRRHYSDTSTIVLSVLGKRSIMPAQKALEMSPTLTMTRALGILA